MPGGDRTGPLGLGPRTGRAVGYCTGYNIPGYANPGYGRGFGRGWGRGFGRGFWRRGRGFWWRGYSEPYYRLQPYIDVYPQPARDEEKTYLEDIIKNLEEEMNMIKDRLKELSKEKKEDSQ
jgi:hypothetical protein